MKKCTIVSFGFIVYTFRLHCFFSSCTMLGGRSYCTGTFLAWQKRRKQIRGSAIWRREICGAMYGQNRSEQHKTLAKEKINAAVGAGAIEKESAMQKRTGNDDSCRAEKNTMEYWKTVHTQPHTLATKHRRTLVVFKSKSTRIYRFLVYFYYYSIP